MCTQHDDQLTTWCMMYIFCFVCMLATTATTTTITPFCSGLADGRSSTVCLYGYVVALQAYHLGYRQVGVGRSGEWVLQCICMCAMYVAAAPEGGIAAKARLGLPPALPQGGKVAATTTAARAPYAFMRSLIRRRRR